MQTIGEFILTCIVLGACLAVSYAPNIGRTWERFKSFLIGRFYRLWARRVRHD